jgi:hypothetical protein
MKITIDSISESINEYCCKYKYFWACGLIEETIKLWKQKENYNLLCKPAKAMANHYIIGGK